MKSRAKSAQAQRKLSKLRKQIDAADQALLRALGKRFEAVERVGVVKAELRLPPRQDKRWREVVAQRLNAGARLGLDGRMIAKIFGIIHGESLRVQRQHARKK